MAQTVDSGVIPYCSNQEFVDRCGWTAVADLLTDPVDRVTPPVSLTLAQVLSSTRLTELLREASGIVEMACSRGARYTPADLTAMCNATTGPTTATNSRSTLVGIVAGVCMWLVFERRPNPNTPVPQRAKMAMQLCDRLAAGELILGFAEAEAAGLPDTNFMTDADYQLLDLATVESERMWGLRSNRFRSFP